MTCIGTFLGALMAPSRRKIITTAALRSEKLATLEASAERLYWRVYMASDNYGTMGAKPWDVMHQCLPGVAGVTKDGVARDIDALVSVELLQRWEADEEPWIHVLGHDKHQAADFMRKRGVRRTPEPPNHKSALGAAKGSEGQSTAISGEVCPSRELSALPTTTSTSTSTSTKEDPPPQEVSTRAEFASLPPLPRRPVVEGAEKGFVDRVERKLSTAFTGDQRSTSEAILWKSKRRGPSNPGYPLEQWEAGVEQLVAAARKGTIPDGADPMAYLHGIVPTAMAKLTPRSDALGADAPREPLHQGSSEAAIAERRRANGRKLLGLDG